MDHLEAHQKSHVDLVKIGPKRQQKKQQPAENDDDLAEDERDLNLAMSSGFSWIYGITDGTDIDISEISMTYHPNILAEVSLNFYMSPHFLF